MFGWLISFLRVGILVETLLLSSRTQSQKKGYESLTFKMTASAFSADVFQLLVLFSGILRRKFLYRVEAIKADALSVGGMSWFTSGTE